jgi:AraC-like DNA-binding protein
MKRLRAGKPIGLLNPKTSARKFQLGLHLPTPDLEYFVEHYWNVRWDLRGQPPYLQENLPHPSIHLVFEKRKTRIYGVMTGKFCYLLQAKGQVFGIKFRPGAFYPFVKAPISRYTDDIVRVDEVFGVDIRPLEAEILALEDPKQQVELAERFLCDHLPPRDEIITLINRVIECIRTDRTIVTVDEVSSRMDLNKRTLQRLFSQYVGVSPKWVIKRYRLHEVTEQLSAGSVIDWARLAQDLGYFDQAHFIKDFKTIVGRTPLEYAKHSGLYGIG